MVSLWLGTWTTFAADSGKGSDVVHDVAYGTAPLQQLNVYPSKREQPMPVMIYVHGGGWRKGDKARVGNKPEFFNSKGWVFVSINYRLVPQVAFPENVSDVACSIDWVYRNIRRYGGDPDRIFIMGHSAGAHLVSLVATDPTYLEKWGRDLKDIKGVISLDTQAYDLVEMLDDWSSDIYSGAFGKDPQVHRAASPQHHVMAGRSIPPFLVCYSKGVSSQQTSEKRAMRAMTFAEKMKQAGLRAELVDASDRNHGEINQWFGLDSDTKVTVSAWRFLESLTSVARMSGWQKSLTFDPEHGAVRPVNAMNLASHKGKLYCGMATSMEKDLFSGKSSYVYVKESADSKWIMDADFGPGTSRVGAMESIQFEFDAQGRKIPVGPVDVLVAFTLRLGRGEDTLQARIRDDDSGKWLTIDLPTPPAATPNVRCMALHRDQVTGGQHLFVCASPAPLGIVKGAYDPQAPGRIRWSSEVELEALSGKRSSRGKWFGMATVNGHLFVSSARRIFRRVDGPESRWVEVAYFSSERDNIDSAPPRGLTAVPVPKGLDDWTENEMLLFSAGGQMWRMRVPEISTGDHTRKMEFNITSKIAKHTNDLAVFTEGAFNRLRFYPEQGGFWPVGFQVVYGVEGRTPKQRDPDSYRLKPQAWYLLRDTTGSYSLEKIEDGQRTLFLARDFEISPFGDQMLYACGYNGSYFKGSLGTAWIFRRSFP
jgi:acetyl esterase/lipase